MWYLCFVGTAGVIAHLQSNFGRLNQSKQIINHFCSFKVMVFNSIRPKESNFSCP